eukprot:6302811-Lingulodinium_polyedra.AAC.1
MRRNVKPHRSTKCCTSGNSHTAGASGLQMACDGCSSTTAPPRCAVMALHLRANLMSRLAMASCWAARPLA